MSFTCTFVVACLAATSVEAVPERLSGPLAHDARGVTSFAAGDDAPRFVAWSEAAVQRELDRIRDAGGGELRFTAGEFVLETGFDLSGARDVRIGGTPDTTLRFAPDPRHGMTLVAEAHAGDTSIRIDRAEHLVVGRRYQLYPESLEGDRILEFGVAGVDGDVITLDQPVRKMGHVDRIPSGSVVVQELNAFNVKRSSDVVFETLRIDGAGRGEVRGHTTFCGIYVVGNPPGREIPVLGGLTVRGCAFVDLEGRGMCVYRMERILVDGCSLRGIEAEGVEIDHFSSGRVVGCDVADCGVGVVLNDAFESVVERNTISRCDIGIAVIKHFTHPHVNRELELRDNVLRDNTRRGISIRDGIDGVVVRRNRFVGTPEDRWIVAPESTVLEGNAKLDDGL